MGVVPLPGGEEEEGDEGGSSLGIKVMRGGTTGGTAAGGPPVDSPLPSGGSSFVERCRESSDVRVHELDVSSVYSTITAIYSTITAMGLDGDREGIRGMMEKHGRGPSKAQQGPFLEGHPWPGDAGDAAAGAAGILRYCASLLAVSITVAESDIPTREAHLQQLGDDLRGFGLYPEAS